MSKFIWSVIALLVGSWIVGVVLKIAEGAIHLLLVVAAFLGIINVVRGRGAGPATE
jgi:hypothetical protein